MSHAETEETHYFWENIFLRYGTKFPLQCARKFVARALNGISLRQIIRLHVVTGTVKYGVLHPLL